MKRGRAQRWWLRLRRVAQVVFLLSFLGLLLAARGEPGWQPPLFLKTFFLLDPLLLVVTFLAAHAVPLVLLASLGTVVVTLVFGRVFCGWFCPLGSVHAFAGWLAGKFQKRPAPQVWSSWQKSKYVVLVLLLGSALAGGRWLLIFDPLVLLYRTTATALLPAVQWVVESGATAVYQTDPHVGPFHLTSLTEPPYRFLRDHVWNLPRQAFVHTGLIWVFFVLIVAANVWRRRFWCRYLCPLGALLGLLSGRPLLRRQLNDESCTGCELCTRDCQGGANEKGSGRDWRPSECFVCFNCTTECPKDCVQFVWRTPWAKQPAVRSGTVSRRAALAALVGGVAAHAAFRATPEGRGKLYRPRLLRPPGARPEPEFLARCTACGLCMKACPTGALQPAVGEAGLEGLWTPHLVPRVGYCDYDCNACGYACPTGAIVPLPLKEKRQVRIGLAAFDPARCIPYQYGRECIVCEEHCPVPDKAIYTVEQRVQTRDGQTRTIKVPRVDPDKCTGCGTCENVCVLRDQPGIRVFSSNESRHPDNQPILPELEDYGADPYG